jgi:hypothetical protein
VDKDFILDEIRRCAVENGGVPLGRERFYAATGIRESDWSGRYWIRWNNALTEAGFAPNRLNQPHAEDHLLRQLAFYVRELGRFPVEAELRMHRRTDPSFPSSNTFKRFGHKRAVIARLHEYCSTEPDLADVAGICAPLLTIKGTEEEGSDGGEALGGFVYLVKSGQHYKIGRSNSAGRRFYEIGLQLPEPLAVVHHFETDDPVGIEHYWHERFKDRRGNGEWFSLTADDIRAFKKRRKFM